MIVNIQSRSVILTPSKCGSTSILYSIKRPWLPCLGPSSWDLENVSPHQDLHFSKIEYKDIHLVGIVVRNPYDRALSLYHQRCRDEDFEGCTFTEWIETYPYEFPFFYPYSRLLNNKTPDFVIHLENIDEEFYKYTNCKITFSKIHEGGYSYKLTHSEKRKIRKVYEDDFTLGRYDKDI